MADGAGGSVSLDSFLACEDVRLEKNGQLTLVGVFSDVLQVPVLPLVFPRLAVLVRISGLESGKRAYSLTITDETQGVEVVAARGEHEQSAGVDSTLSIFTFRFGAVQARSWGVFTLKFTTSDGVSFSRALRLRPPSWDMIYLRCSKCGSFVPSGINVAPGATVQLSRCQVQCSNCAHMSELDDKTAVRLSPPSFALEPDSGRG